MAFKRSDLRSIVGDALTDEQIKKVMDAIHSEIDSIKDELDEYKKSDKSEEWKSKYEKEHEAFEAFKADREKKDTVGRKKDALKALLASEESKLSEKGQAKALKYADLDSIELNADGSIKGAKKLLDTYAEEWSDYVTGGGTEGAEVHGKDGAAKKSGGKPTTREEIMKIEDPAKRQAAIEENHELFGY